MEIHERIREFRESQKLSRDAFGERIGVSRDVIANIELNRLARPEQKEPLYKLICKEFHLNEKWLMTGEGEPFNEEAEEDIYTRAAVEIDAKDPLARQAIIKYWQLTDEDKKLFWAFMEKFVTKKQED